MPPKIQGDKGFAGGQPRHVRIENRPKTVLISEDGSNWAVSYSDILMVLMSFFVIFFSMGKTDSSNESLVAKIALEMGVKTNAPAIDAKQQKPFNGTTKGEGGKPEHGWAAATIQGHLKGLNIEAKAGRNDDELIINLPDQIYNKREFILNASGKAQLTTVLNLLLQYQNQIRIVFVGHSDSSLLTNGNAYLENNFDLSSLRASRAMEIALRMGIDKNILAMEAAASNLRNSRTLSIKIIHDK